MSWSKIVKNLLLVWRDIVLVWRWPAYEHPRLRTGTLRAMILLNTAMLVGGCVAVGYLGSISGPGKILLAPTLGVILYLFTEPYRKTRMYLAVSWHAIAFLDLDRGGEVLREAGRTIQGAGPHHFRRNFKKLLEYSEDVAYKTLKNTSRDNQETLTENDLCQLLQARHPGLRKEAIRLLGDNPQIR